jgi:hypothetical protein
MIFISKYSIKVVILLLLETSVSAQDTNNIYLVVKKEGKFDVLFNRAISTATGAALGGLIGAAIEEGIRSGEDKKKLKPLLPHVTDTSCRIG